MLKPDPRENLSIPLGSLQTKLIITPEGNSLCYELPDAEALEFNESPYQILEGNFYEFEFEDSKKYTLVCRSNGSIVNPSKRHGYRGRICPNIYVGKLKLEVQEISSGLIKETIYLEVLATKFDTELDSRYRDNYRIMLEEITEKCTDILMQINSPVQQSFTVDFDQNPQTIYQRFSFVNSIINGEDFENAVLQVIKNPSVAWARISEQIPVQKIKRVNRSVVRQMTSGSGRIGIENDYLNSFGLKSLPQKIETDHKTETVDTNENRFIKHALEAFLQFANDCRTAFQKFKYVNQAVEAQILIQKLDNFLNQPFFKEIGKPDSLQLNSPLLQRRAGYREILNRWLQFDLAARLIWEGGEDVYEGGKKDIATLYEYWLFFKLLDLFQSYFRIKEEDLSKLIVPKEEKLKLEIKQGKKAVLSGVYDTGGRKLNIQFNYNRSFEAVDVYPKSGSWTTTLRPDYTLSFWPLGIDDKEAEKQELIVHIHFDAKYKVSNLFNDNRKSGDELETQLDEEKKENRKGIYKNADLLKMHAYKDAIRRTGGAYILYPGSEATRKKGFHEIIPGLGAFPVRPSKTDNGMEHLKSFITEVIEHFTNRTSQREKYAYRTFDVHKTKPSDEDAFSDLMPETYGRNRSLFADETYVLVGYYKSEAHLEWIIKNGHYNFRMNSERGSLILNNDTINARYLLLHTKNDNYSTLLFEIKENNFEVITKQHLIDLDYPEPSQDLYVITKVNPEIDKELKELNWDFKNLKNYKKGYNSALPFTCSLKELLDNKL
ncbi:DUF2357 domain-containing protein [Fluviicola taffensis]|uniref:DUF2357 domain-containing protein n=1 Tax=Fluviicola taffensis TaxID=191579 RepID=UPI0031384949